MNNDYLRGWCDGYMEAWFERHGNDREPTEELPAFEDEGPTEPARRGFDSDA